MSSGRAPAWRPPATGTEHVLPFGALDPLDFERLCLWLVRAEGFSAARHTGLSGGDGGRDLVARDRSGGRDERVFFQCKRYKGTLGASLMTAELHKLARTLGPGRTRPTRVVFVTSARVTAEAEDEVAGRADALGFDVAYWAETELDMMVRAHDHLLAQFFRLPQTPPRPAETVPRNLPRAPMRFVNRDLELGALDRVMDELVGATAPRVAVLAGMYGVGKSAVVAHWANANAGAFAGGSLFADLALHRRGSGVEVSEVLADFLRELGVPASGVPSAFAQRRRLFESITSRRRLLVVVDDADHPAQVVPLVPTGPGSLVVVSSRHRLEELLYEGAELVEVAPFDEPTGLRLVREYAGEERLRSEPDAVSDLVGLTGGLPVVLCVCAGRIAGAAPGAAGSLLRRVRSAPRLLPELSGEGRWSVQSVLDAAYGQLQADQALVYLRAGVVPGPDLPLGGIAAAAGLGMARAADACEALVGSYLLGRAGPERYRLHDLVREHAAARGVDDDPRGSEEALSRLVGWYVAALQRADRAVHADRLRVTERVPDTHPGLPELVSPADALAWFLGERANVMAVMRVASERGWDAQVLRVAETMWPLAANQKLFSEWTESDRLAVASAVRAGDRAAEARFRSTLARAYADLGDHPRALAESRTAEAGAVGVDRALRASVTEFAGICDLMAGRVLEAVGRFVDARAAFAAAGVARGVTIQDYHLGWAALEAGRPEAALEPLGRALDSFTTLGDEIGVGRALLRRGQSLVALGRYDEGGADLAQSLAVMARAGVAYERGLAYEALAESARARGEASAATAHTEEALRTYRACGHPRAAELARP